MVNRVGWLLSGLLVAGLAGCASAAKRQAQADEQTRRAFAMNQVMAGEYYALWGNAPAATRAYARALEAAPPPDIAYVALNERAQAWTLLGDYDRALSDYSEAIKLGGALAPRRHEALVARGWLYELRGEPDRAFADLDQAIESDPKDVPAWVNRGVCRWLQERPEEALADFRQALALDPKNYAACLSAAILSGRAEGVEAVKAQVHRCARHAGDRARLPVAMRLLGGQASEGELLQWVNQLPNEGSRARQACELYFWSAEYVLLTGDTTGAETRLRAAIAAGPRDQPERQLAERELARLRPAPSPATP